MNINENCVLKGNVRRICVLSLAEETRKAEAEIKCFSFHLSYTHSHTQGAPSSEMTCR